MPVNRDIDPDQKQRTLKQNRAGHLYFAHIADTLNESGLNMQAVLTKRVGVRWTDVSVKECLFKGLAKAMYNVDSTTKLDTKQFTKVADMLGDILAKDYGVVTEFPSMETLMQNEQSKITR